MPRIAAKSQPRARRAIIEPLEPRRLLAAAINFTEFPQIGGGTNFVQNLTAGPDGNVYFSSELANNVGSISPAGAVKIYDTTSIAAHGASGVAAGSDGNIYLNAGNNFGMINLANGTVSAIPLSAALKSGGRMALGQDGNFWSDGFFATIERITPAGQVTDFNYSGSGSGQIVSFNGQLYFSSGNFIRDVSTSGTFGTAFGTPSGGNVEGIAVGPDGNLWFTEQLTVNSTTSNFFGYLTPGGTIKEFASPIGPVSGIAAGSDGNIYYRAADYLVGVNTSGTMIAEQNLGGGNNTDGKELIALGTNLWFNESFNDRIGVAHLGGSPPPPGGGGTLTPTVSKETLPAQAVAGAKLKGAVTVNIADSGTASSGRVTIAIYASTTGSLNGATLIAGPKASTLKLKHGQSKAVAIKITALPATLAAGSYYLVSQVTSAGVSTSAASAGTVTVAPPFVSLSGTVASLTPAAKAGKMESAVITVSNGGNIQAAGALQVALSARPADTTGSADVTIATATTRIHILPGKSGRAALHFLVPATLAAGTYSLVVQLDPGKAFKESALPPLIVSSQTFVVG